MRNLALLIILLLLTACSIQDAQVREVHEIERIEKKLPVGCTFHNLGFYYTTPIFMIRCEKQQTSTTINFFWHDHAGKVGKVAHHGLLVSLED